MRPREFLRHGFVRLRRDGVAWAVSAVFNRLFPGRPALLPDALAAVQNGAGIEIGGPSALFAAGGILPLYPHVARLDNVNFAARTAWEAGLEDGGEFRFDGGKPAGRQFLREATALRGIGNDTYDFVLSSHCLEHVANPLAAVRDWRRVVRPGGFLILVLPDPSRSFDCARPITTLEHLRADFEQAVGEDDLTHLEEILARHDLGRDPRAGSAEAFRARAERNAENRCLHHHVFDLDLMRATLVESGWTVRHCERVRPVHLMALARNDHAGAG